MIRYQYLIVIDAISIFAIDAYRYRIDMDGHRCDVGAM